MLKGIVLTFFVFCYQPLCTSSSNTLGYPAKKAGTCILAGTGLGSSIVETTTVSTVPEERTVWWC
jgi:hypothetical protein